jgi:subtilisin-like proprotein convertase family protein
MTKRRFVKLATIGCASAASLALSLGVSPASAKTVTKTATFNQCVNFAVPIVDPVQSKLTADVANVPVTVPNFKKKRQDGVVTAFSNVGVRISHTDDGDISFMLISPAGKAAVLSSQNDDSSNSSGDGYGNGPASCAGGLVSFGDAFTTSITSPGNGGADAPIVGSFKPEQPLSAFAGGPARGVWTLLVLDFVGGDPGSINGVSLNFTYQYKALKKRKKK